MRTALVTGLLCSLHFSWAKVVCPGEFTPISAVDYVRHTNPGWNLGNTLDAVPDEGSWNNSPVQESTFDDVLKAGFKSVRLPVTWTAKIGPAPDYTIDAKWLDRVSKVLDMITSRGLYAIVNVHHDSWQWFDFTAPGANIPEIERKFVRVWEQIGTKLACKSGVVAFEPINEAKGDTKEHADILNRMNDRFLHAINEAGGFNPQRVVTLVGLGEDSVKTSQWFKRPDGKYKNPWAIQYHYYSPYDFVFTAWGRTIWGSAEDKQKLEDDLRLIRQNFTDIPLIIGEWEVNPRSTDFAARWQYFDHFIRMAAKYNTSTILWDNGDGLLDRKAHVLRDKVSNDVLMNAVNGVKNSLPVSTSDVKAATQQSSAYVFHRATLRDAGAPQTVSFSLNGNTIKAVKSSNGKHLQPEDYAINGKSITFNPSLLSKYFMSPEPGIKAKLKVEFSAGADLEVQLVQWNRPTFTGSSSSRLSATKGKDLLIPITWKGIDKIAAVKAVYEDGSFIVDAWTKWMGPLQAGYATYNNHWDWDAGHVILKKGIIDVVAKKGKKAIFTVDFWPRGPGNSLNYTLLV